MPLNLSNPITTPPALDCAEHQTEPPQMLKTFSLSVLFFLTLGVMFAAYASVPVPL
jgi:hypothetical protein